MIAYRDATVADGPALDTMARAIWVETFAHLLPPENAAAYLATAYGPDGALIRDLGDPAIRVRLACEGEAIIGYAKLCPPWLPDAEADAIQLHQFYIARDWQGRGVADALMEWTLATAREQGARAVLLTVWEENPRARRFYERHGFTYLGDYGFRVGNQIDTDHILRRPL